MMRTIKAFKQDGKQGFTLKGRLNNLDSRYVFGIVFLQLIILFFFGFFYMRARSSEKRGQPNYCSRYDELDRSPG
jgi:hypothetical protein